MKIRPIFTLLVLASLGACQSLQRTTQSPLNETVLYRQAIQRAIYPDSSKIYKELVSINQQNKNLIWKKINGEDYVLTVTWKSNVSYYKPYLDSAFYNTGPYPIWVTTAPELQQRIKKEKPSDLNKRLKQLLGLPPNASYSYFVEFWIRPTDLFRPCPDKEVTDAQCETCFPKTTDSAHQAWINENRISRYYQCDLFQQYPWTQLGYTYDWDPQNKSHVGLSEFVVGAHKNIVINAIYTTSEYLK